MAAAGFVAGTVFGVLIGIKFNIGAKPPRLVPVESTAGAVDKTGGGRNGTDPAGLLPESDYDSEATLAEINDYHGKISVENPLRGIWTARFNDFAVTLNFTQDLKCEIYDPITSGGKVLQVGKFVDSIPYEVKVFDEDPQWAPVEDGNDKFKWSDVEIITTYEYTNRDGSSGTARKTHRVGLTARYLGKDTPQDADDYINYELEFLGDFFELGEEGDTISLPASRKWERKIEADFRNNPNPEL